MKIADIRSKSDTELEELLNTLKKENFNIRFKRANGITEGCNNAKNIRRNIARVMTVLNKNNKIV